MYSKIEILKKQRAAAAIVIALDLILIFVVNALQDNIISFNLTAITCFMLWTQLLINKEHEEEANKNRSIQPPIRGIWE